jgi:hypothetical protein
VIKALTNRPDAPTGVVRPFLFSAWGGTCMFLFPLQAGGISMDINKMEFENLALVVGFGLVVIALGFMHGITLKWGDKEIIIGGIKKLLAKKDADTRLKEELKRFTDEIDNDITNQLYDMVDGIDFRLEELTIKEHCFFSFGEFMRLVREELKKRIRQNNLKERMAEESREKYIDRIIHNVRERYTVFQYKVANVKCGDTYSDFSVIEAVIKREITDFVNDAVNILIAGMKKKIDRYEMEKPNFKTKDARKFCCDDRIVKNKVYIKKLTGEVPV